MCAATLLLPAAPESRLDALLGCTLTEYPCSVKHLSCPFRALWINTTTLRMWTGRQNISFFYIKCVYMYINYDSGIGFKLCIKLWNADVLYLVYPTSDYSRQNNTHISWEVSSLPCSDVTPDSKPLMVTRESTGKYILSLFFKVYLLHVVLQNKGRGSFTPKNKQRPQLCYAHAKFTTWLLLMT